jgi:hypothetical protein
VSTGLHAPSPSTNARMASRRTAHREKWGVPIIMTAFPTEQQDAARAHALQPLHTLAALVY